MRTVTRLQTPLLTLRLGVFVVLFMWTIDKFVNPEHAAAVYENFYFIGGLGATVMTVIGIVELALIIGFLLGVKKTITYGFVLAIHTVSTLTPYDRYLGFDDLLFFAAWPMLAACYTLFVLRDLDTKFTLKKLA
jgi:hypothetical protein